MNYAKNDGEGEWLSSGRFATLLGLLILVSFPQVVAGLEAFNYMDAGQFAYPVAFYHRESFWRGEMPMWNPLNSCGIPFLAQWNTLTLYPLSLFYLLFPLPWSFSIFCLGHLFLGGMGMYFLAHRWTGNRLAASTAGAVFAFNGLTWYGLMWPHIIAALSWMPWVVLTMERAWCRGKRAMILAALAGAMQMLSGGAEVIIQTWLLLGALWLAKAVVAGRGTQVPSLKSTARSRKPQVPISWFTGSDDAQGWVPMAWRFALVVLLVAGLAAAQLLPFLDLLAHSQRDSGYGGGGMSGVCAMPLTGWVNFLVPLFHCFRNSQGLYMQVGQTWTGSYYVGGGIVMLALLAVWRVRNQRVWLLAGLALFGLLMALGSKGPVYDGFKRLVPMFGFIRFPIKFVMLATFALPMLAAYGLCGVQGMPAENREREWKSLKMLVLGLLAGMAAIVWVDCEYPLVKGEAAVTAANALARAVFLGLIFGCIAGLRRATDGKRVRIFQTAFIVLLWFDVFTHAPNLSPTVPPATLEPDAVRQVFNWGQRLEAGQSRAMVSKDALWKMASSGSDNLEVDSSGRRLSLNMNFNLLDHAAKFDGFYSMDIREYLEVFKHAYFTTNAAAQLKDFLGISLETNPTNVLEWVSRDSFLPLISAGQKPVFAPPDAILSTLMSQGFEPLTTVYLPLEAQAEVLATQPATVRQGPTQISPCRLSVEVEASSPTLVVVAQTFYHPWRAYVDGVPTRLWRANYAFQALQVPSGRHHVSLVYEDRLFWTGLVMSLLSLLVCAVSWFWWRNDRDVEAVRQRHAE